MKILEFDRDNQTLSCMAENYEEVYTASFEFYPFYEGKDFAVYKGLYNGFGPKRGELCVVKSKLNKTQKKHTWYHISAISNKAHQLSYLFNSCVKCQVIQFTSPRHAILDTVSDFIPLVRLFKHHENKLKNSEAVLMEDFLEGKFERYGTRSSLENSENCDGILEAFSHFTWDVSRHIVVCGFQGFCRDATYQLTTPIIHSVTGSFGESDREWPGIMDFFALHRCNNICGHWIRPDVPRKLTYIHTPSAPPYEYEETTSRL